MNLDSGAVDILDWLYCTFVADFNQRSLKMLLNERHSYYENYQNLLTESIRIDLQMTEVSWKVDYKRLSAFSIRDS